jgi:hypothetical protein
MGRHACSLLSSNRLRCAQLDLSTIQREVEEISRLLITDASSYHEIILSRSI